MGRDCRGDLGFVEIRMNDEERERLIEAWRVVLELSPQRSYREIAAAAMKAEIRRRSPQQVEQMECERGLC